MKVIVWKLWLRMHLFSRSERPSIILNAIFFILLYAVTKGSGDNSSCSKTLPYFHLNHLGFFKISLVSCSILLEVDFKTCWKMHEVETRISNLLSKKNCEHITHKG